MDEQSLKAPVVKVLLLAGGIGARLRPLTDTLPKCLVPIGERPLLGYWLDCFEAAGLREVLINNHHLPDAVRAYLKEVNTRGTIHVAEAYEPELLGSAGTVRANRAFADDADHIVIVYADNLSDVDLGALIRHHQSHGAPATMMLFYTDYPERCGIVRLDGDGTVAEFVEKPEKPESNLANAGLYLFTADAYREIADMEAFDLGFDVLPAFVNRMRGWVWNGYHRDIGTMESLEAARREAPSVFALKNSGTR